MYTTQPPDQTTPQQDMQTLIRNTYETRNAVRFIAWVVGIYVLISLVIGVIVGVQLAKIGDTVNPNTDISTCLSLGGTDPSC